MLITIVNIYAKVRHWIAAEIFLPVTSFLLPIVNKHISDLPSFQTQLQQALYSYTEIRLVQMDSNKYKKINDIQITFHLQGKIRTRKYVFYTWLWNQDTA